MKLIFIYGPMSVGKFTTAKALSDLTGIKLFHNHLTVDAVNAIFPEHGELRDSLLRKLRFIMLEAAAKNGRDVIFTFGYSGKRDDDQVKAIVDATEDKGGKVCFVQLYAPLEVLAKDRIRGQSRQAMAKVTDEAYMRNKVIERDMYTAVPFANNFKIDNTNLPPAESAKKIAAHFKLPLAG